MSDFKAKMHKIVCWLGLRPRPRWGSLYNAPTDPLAGGEASAVPLHPSHFILDTVSTLQCSAHDHLTTVDFLLPSELIEVRKVCTTLVDSVKYCCN